MLTVADWGNFPDDLLRHEIIAGEHYTQRAPDTRHQRIVGDLLYTLDEEARACGEVIHYVGAVLSPFDAVVPDLTFTRAERRSIITEKYIEGPPDIIIEVVLDETRVMDETIKRALYARFGVAEYWIVDPEAALVKIHRHGKEIVIRGGTVTSPLLPNFALDLDRVFEN